MSNYANFQTKPFYFSRYYLFSNITTVTRKISIKLETVIILVSNKVE